MRKARLSWKVAIKHAVWYVIDGTVSILPIGRRTGHVLLVRLDNIGDFVLWLDSAKRISSHYRTLGHKVILVASSSWAPWAKKLGYFDQVVSVDRNRFAFNPAYRFRTDLQIRRLGCSVAIMPIFSRDWLSGDSLIRVCNAPVRIGSSGEPGVGMPWERPLSDSWYTTLFPANPENMMELARNAEFTSNLLGHPVEPNVADLRELYGPDHTANELQNLGIPAGNYFVLFPGSSDPAKCWPVESFRTLARRIHKSTGWPGILCGGPEDVELGSALCDANDIPLLNLAGRTSLPELAAALGSAGLLVSNDTAAVHIAATLSVPTVCILGGGHVDRFLPYPKTATEFPMLPSTITFPMDCFDCKWHCKFPVIPGEPAPCIAHISVDAVWQMTQSLIDSTGTQRTRL